LRLWTAKAAQAALATQLVEPSTVRTIAWEPRERQVEVLGPSRLAARAAGAAARLAAWAEASPRDYEHLRRVLKSAWDTAERDEQEQQASLLRELFRPFPSRTIAPIPSAGPGTRGYRIAESLYEDRCFEGLPVLADLLEEAGVTDAGLLGHLRSPGPHALGCWALDAVLGTT
jgi:hypothetical protein